MSETRHTAGPWVNSYFSKPDGSPIVTVDDVAETIAGSARHSARAELFGVTLDDASTHEAGRATVVCYTGNGPNAHNNARLIAAAPDLLAACRLVSALGEAERREDSDAVWTDEFRSIFEASEAAIARAEGR